MSKSFTIDIDTSSLNALFDELTVEVELAARPAAQAAAQVLYDSVQQNVRGIGRVTGNLANAIYQAFSESNSAPGIATYHVSWNARKAPHGHLVEFGHIQRYASYIGKDGRWHTAVKPNMRGKPRPSRRASQAAKDAYYVLRPGGPAQVPAKSFIRAAASRFPQALQAAETELLNRIAKK